MKFKSLLLFVLFASVLVLTIVLANVLRTPHEFVGYYSADRIVYQGYIYPQSDIWADFGRVQVLVQPSSNMNLETEIMEYVSPYTLFIYVISHPNWVKDHYENNQVTDVSVKDVQVKSSDGEILFQSAAGKMQNSSSFVRSWVSELNALKFERQELVIEFTLVVHASGEELQEFEQVSVAPEFYQVRNGDRTGATP